MKPFLLVFVAAILLFSSCKKDPEASLPPAPPVKKNLSVQLQAAYLDAAKIDSAFATWKINGTEQTIKMIVRNDSLIAGLDNFAEGAGNLAIYIYSKKKFGNQYLSHWVLKKDLTLQQSTGIDLNGPSSFKDADWFPRVELKDGIGHEAIIGLRPEDAYFLVKNIHVWPGLLSLLVDKSYWKTIGGIQGVGQGTWECSSGCADAKGNAENTSYFNFIPAQIGSKTWNHIEVVVFYQMDAQGGGWGLSFTYDI